MAAKTTATPARKTTKKSTEPKPKNFTPTIESLAAIEAGKEHGMRISEFTNRALVFYAEHLGYLTNSPPSVEARLDVLEYLAFLDRKEKICQKLSDDQLEMAKKPPQKDKYYPNKKHRL